MHQDAQQSHSDRSDSNLSHFVEIVLAPCMGLGLSWGVYRMSPYGLPQAASLPVIEYVVFFGPVFLSVVSLLSVIGLAIEKCRRRSPKRWGAGRWALTTMALYMTALLARDIALPFARDHELVSAIDLIMTTQEAWLDVSPFLISFWIVARALGVPRAPVLDAREWYGRSFTLLVLLQFGISAYYPWSFEDLGNSP